jgi:hypothetical protein
MNARYAFGPLASEPSPAARGESLTAFDAVGA